MNMAANMLGVGNAATPAGLEAIREMKAMGRGGGEATDDMCMLLVVNCSSLQLIPTTVIALRQAAGSVSASDILLPAILASVTATAFGIAAARAMATFSRRRY
jgi:spore maturation protein A